MQETHPHHTRIAIVGAGFSGIGTAIRLRREGIEDFVVLERSGDVGGTWLDNTYPGCQCDVPSHLYSFSFAPNPDWSRTYSMGEEIWRYLQRCAEEGGITPHLRLEHDVREAEWDAGAQRWRLETSQGPLTASYLVAAPGPLSEPRIPDLPGLDRFEGAAFHSARWDHGQDLSGKRVAVVGTGASAIQIVPKLQPRVERLYVLQRTPPWVLPHSDRPIARAERALYRAFPPAQRLARAWVYLAREAIVPGLVRRRPILRVLERMARRHLRRQVPDPKLRRRLTPSYRLGCKRILPSDDYYPALTRPNVELVTEPIRELRERSLVTADGPEREIDALVLATGFKVTEMPFAERVRGRDGRLLSEAWNGSPQAYLGTTVAGFPNMFLLIGPNTGSGHTSLVYMAEAQIDYLLDTLREAERRGAVEVEVRPEAQRAYNERIQARMPGTVWMSGGCSSWYIDRNGRNTTIWPDFTWRFRRRTRSFDPAAYRLRPAP